MRSHGRSGEEGREADARRGALAGIGIAAVAGAVAFLATSGRVHEPPSRLLVAGAAVVLAAAVLAPARARRVAAVAAAAVAGGIAGHVLGRTGMPRIHDLDHLWGIWAYGRCLAEGVPYPLWVPYLGAGMPLFQFYGPVNFLLAAPWILAGLDPVSALKAELFAGHVLSALSFFLAARHLGAGRRAALVAGAAGAFAPWRLAVFDYRGALGEANAFVLAPLVVASALRAVREPGQRTPALLLASVAGLVLTHPPTLLTLFVALLPAVALETIGSRAPAAERLRRLRAAAVPVLLAAGLTAWWWLPAAAEAGAVSVAARSGESRYFRYGEHGVAPASLLERRLWDRSRISIPDTQRRRLGLEGEQMPFYAGAVLMIAGVAAPLWSRRSRTGGLALGAAAALALSTAPAARALGGLPGFAQLYFPWRFLTPATALAALALALAVDRCLRGDAGWSARAMAAAILALLVWDGAPYTGAADRIPPYAGVVHGCARPGVRPEFWDRDLLWVPVRLPEGRGIVRTWDLKLPPDSYRAEVDALYYVYAEWVSPALYRTYWLSRDPARMAEAGVSLVFQERSPEPLRLSPRPYASVKRGDGGTLPVPPDRVRRGPGAISVSLDAAPRPGRLVVLEQSFPGWKASVDGKDTGPAGEAGGFLAVDLPPGARRVDLRYGVGTPWRILGLAISGLVAAATAGAVGRHRGASRGAVSPGAGT